MILNDLKIKQRDLERFIIDGIDYQVSAIPSDLLEKEVDSYTIKDGILVVGIEIPIDRTLMVYMKNWTYRTLGDEFIYPIFFKDKEDAITFGWKYAGQGTDSVYPAVYAVDISQSEFLLAASNKLIAQIETNGQQNVSRETSEQ